MTDRSADILATAPHRRLNQLTGEWVLVSPHRTARPWQGQLESAAPRPRPAYDPDCYLCPGNGRAGGERNPHYSSVFVFDNDFAALHPDPPRGQPGTSDLLVAQTERGLCRVVCFSPRHDLSLATMTPAAIRRVIDTWTDEYRQLGELPWVRHVQIFENRGPMMGASNPHPHGQIWANETLPNEAAKEITRHLTYAHEHRACLLCDYLATELRVKDRLVFSNGLFAVLVPFWATWPFEALVLPTTHRSALTDLAADERDALAEAMHDLSHRYDALFTIEFPYSMGIHQAPTDDSGVDPHLHAHYYPPLLRSATVRKFMVGYELLGQPQRDITPEWAAARLREVST